MLDPVWSKFDIPSESTFNTLIDSSGLIILMVFLCSPPMQKNSRVLISGTTSKRIHSLEISIIIPGFKVTNESSPLDYD